MNAIIMEINYDFRQKRETSKLYQLINIDNENDIIEIQGETIL